MPSPLPLLACPCSAGGLVCDTSTKTCVLPPAAPGLSEVASSYDESGVLNMQVTLAYPDGNCEPSS